MAKTLIRPLSGGEGKLDLSWAFPREEVGGPYSREGVARFLEAVREYVDLLERARGAALQAYGQSCGQQVRVKTVLKKNYVKLEVVLRPGKPQERCLDLARQLEVRLNQLRKALDGEQT